MNNMKRFLTFAVVLIGFTGISYGAAFDYDYLPNGYKYVKHSHYESSYQRAWCEANKGIVEYENKDKTRVDCLTKTHAVEFDFANKWAESVGQALYYGIKTGLRPKVVLILENPKKQMVYFKRVEELAKKYNFDAEYVTPAILNLKDGKCPYLDCKCHKVTKN